MTQKQLIQLIETISLDHKQIRSFFHNVEASEWLNDHKAKYPAVFLLDQQGSISVSGNSTTVGFTMFFVDMVHADDHTKQNELDVQSDMLQVAQDIMAQLNYPTNPYALSGDNPFNFIVEGDTESDNDLFSGVRVDFSIRQAFQQDVCAIPSTFMDYGSEIVPGSSFGLDSKTYDYEYVADGTEGTTLTLPVIQGKKILIMTRESGTLYKTTGIPDTAEYTFDGTVIGLGLATIAGARFLILYRNY